MELAHISHTHTHENTPNCPLYVFIRSCKCFFNLISQRPQSCAQFFQFENFPVVHYTCASRKYFISDKMQTNSSNCKENSVVRQSEIRAMWVVGTVSVSHCDHNSFSGTAEYMGVIHTKSSKACCSVFFFPAVTWSGL